ncbi:hypothetical protein [Microbacterium sp. YJN-G]|uniref:hypothetical protein n=1 Tax=Microbacterium sp. YJN-G TaxID=2763257 RepID=UPI00187871C8|nr:hypothetical protein [Microbacterium sp. YJN-G]
MKSKAVKVSLGGAVGHRVAHIARQGELLPEGVVEAQLKSLVARGLVEKVKDEGSDVDEGAYKGTSVADLKAEIEKRNEGRGDDAKIVPAEPGNRPQIVAALIADDSK